MQELVGAIRAIRAEYGVQPGQQVRASVTAGSPAARAAFDAERGTILRLARLSRSRSAREASAWAATRSSATAPASSCRWAMRSTCSGSATAWVRRSRGSIELVDGQTRKLGNAQFTARAPAEVVERERLKLASWTEQSARLGAKRALLGC